MYEITPEVISNRQKVINYLRTNPEGFEQINGDLTDFQNGRCALGMAAEALEISLRNYPHKDDDGNYPYVTIEEKLAADSMDVWRLNDRDNLSFSAIADILESWWFKEAEKA